MMLKWEKIISSKMEFYFCSILLLMFIADTNSMELPEIGMSENTYSIRPPDQPISKREKRSPPVVAALSALMPFNTKNTTSVSLSTMIDSIINTSSDRKHFSSSLWGSHHDKNYVNKLKNNNLPPSLLSKNHNQNRTHPSYSDKHTKPDTFYMNKKSEKYQKIYVKNRLEKQKAKIYTNKTISNNSSISYAKKMKSKIKKYPSNETPKFAALTQLKNNSTNNSSEITKQTITPVLKTTNVPFSSTPEVGTIGLIMDNKTTIINNISDHENITTIFDDIMTTENESVDNSTLKNSNHIDLNVLEKQLTNQESQQRNDLLLAISILQHHTLPKLWINETLSKDTHEVTEQNNVTESTKDEVETTQPFMKFDHMNVEVNQNFFGNPFDFTNFTEEQLSTEQPYITEYPESANSITPEKQQLKWFVLVMEGDCSIIRSRMTAFVTFLKAALSTKLETEYEDILVPSVFCDNTFMVNISLDINKYPQAQHRLQDLAQANTTLLEISDEIFYLEKILTKTSEHRFQPHVLVKSSDDIQLVIYIAVGCMCVFILLSVIIVALIRTCKHDDDNFDMIKPEYHDPTENYTIHRPNVIYSQRFSQDLNPEKYRLKPFEETDSQNETGVAPSSSGNFGSSLKYGSERNDGFSSDYYERKSHTIQSSSKLELLEEVQEEDEEVEDEDEMGTEEDFQLNDDDEEELEEAEYIANNLESVLRSTEQNNCGSSSNSFTQRIRNLALPSSSKSKEDRQIGFDNPCYGR